MNDQIICPHCKKPIPLTEALTHDMRESAKRQMEEQEKRLIGFYKQRLQEERLKIVKESEIEIRAKIQKEMDLKIRDSKNETEELSKQNKTLQEQSLELNKLIRQLRLENDKKRLELEKKLVEDEQKIREEEQKRMNEEYRLKIREKEKKLEDALKMNEELKRKLEQGSQQTQGEVLELELEHMLQREFPCDEIKPVAKGQKGGDIVQVVRNSYGKLCGTIMWETKRTKAWSEGWITKLKEDQRREKAEMAVLISNVLPEEISNFGYKDGVWIGNYESIIGCAVALRINLIEMTALRLTQVGKKEKMEILYTYLSGIEFKQRVEAIVEAFTAMQEDLEKEKRLFTAKWAKQEKNIRRVIDNTSGMYGDLQSIIGKALTGVKGLEMLPEGKEDKASTLF